jgi:glycosyltransferase involved in cell wall biosynthesis
MTFITLRAAGWPVYSTRAHAESIAAVIRGSNLFDAGAYTARLRLGAEIDPALHYVLVGERLGHPPSDRFDPTYYGERYPDIAISATCYLAHYVQFGHQEGRRPRSVAAGLTFSRLRLNPLRQTVLLISHEASRTGAPILSYNLAKRLRRQYNVVTLLLGGGELISDFEDQSVAVIGPLTRADWHPVEAECIVKHLVASYSITYAIANSIESRIMLKSLTCAFVPVVSLVHEFSSHVRPKGEMGRALEWATQIVFSAEIVAASASAEYPNLENRIVHILPQGRTVLPPRKPPRLQVQNLRAKIRPLGTENAIVVLSCSTVTIRKGTDLFLACAAAVAAMAPLLPVRFVWVGEGFGSEREREYSTFLSEQIVRSGLEDKVVILDEVTDVDPVYSLADMYFLSSRLDPLPNVAIDAALHGMPVICFDNAGGFADFLKREEITRMGVVPYLDVHAAALVIAKLAADAATRRELGKATCRLAETVFDMDRYVRELDRIGCNAASIMRQRSEDFETIDADPMFDMNLFLGPDDAAPTRQDAIRIFLARWAALGLNKRPTANFYFRRPAPGFHPQVYAYENSDAYDVAVVNPLAHFSRSGKPEGPWRHDVITPPLSGAAATVDVNLRCAIHAHLYYPELAADFLRKITVNQSRCDLLLSTSDHAKVRTLRTLTRDYDKGAVLIRLVPNRGRDIGAFLTAFAQDILGSYDVVGHLHGKRSLFIGDPAVGESWREFLWQDLVGDLYPMMDIIINRFAADDGLGIVFPEDAHLSDWDFNRDIATRLAQRMGIEGRLPPYFDFPIGTMFWARTEALRPLFELKLDWPDYPEEPVPIDGTILHALERLLPFAARRAGYRYATSHISGVTW